MVSKAVFRIPDEQETYIIGEIFFVSSGHLAGTRATGPRMVRLSGPLQRTSADMIWLGFVALLLMACSYEV